MVMPPLPTDIIQVNYNLDVDYSMMIHKSWLPMMNPILNSKYMRDMMVLLHELYKIQYVTPAKTDIFKCFKLTDFNELKVVIVGKEPYLNSNATGLLNAIPPTQVQTPRDLNATADCIQDSCYKGFNIGFDYTLESWAQQGVLLLNSAMTNFEGDLKQLTLWRNFTREMVKALDLECTGIHFLFLGEEAKYFERFVNTDFNWTYTFESPEEAIAKNRRWMCPHFASINIQIEESNGPEEVVEW